MVQARDAAWGAVLLSKRGRGWPGQSWVSEDGML